MKSIGGLSIGDTLYHLVNGTVIFTKITEIDSNNDGIYLYCKDTNNKQYRFILIVYSNGKTHFGTDVFKNINDVVSKIEEKEKED